MKGKKVLVTAIIAVWVAGVLAVVLSLVIFVRGASFSTGIYNVGGVFEDSNIAITHGNVYNFVIKITFPDKEEGERHAFNEENSKFLTALYSSDKTDGIVSVNEYYETVSKGNLDVRSAIGFEFIAPHEKAYYLPYKPTTRYSKGNSVGYFAHTAVKNGRSVSVYDCDCNGNCGYLFPKEGCDLNALDGVVCNCAVKGCALQDSFDRRYREQTLVNAAVNAADEYLSENRIYVNGARLTASDLDKNEDGFIDLLSIVVGGDFGYSNSDAISLSWYELLWPHSWTLTRDFSDYDKFTKGEKFEKEKSELMGGSSILGKNAFRYTLIPLHFMQNSDGTGGAHTGVAVHEIMHVLGGARGVSDLYYYNEDAYSYPVGDWDIMGSTASVPQSMNGYYRSLMGWVTDDNIIEVTGSGTYTINDSLSTKGATLLKFGERGDEFFMAEWREKPMFGIDSTLPSGGLTVFRVNTNTGSDQLGNMDHNYPDEIKYFCVDNGGEQFSSAFDAALSDGQSIGYDGGVFGDKNSLAVPKGLRSGQTRQPYLAYSDGTNSGITVKVTKKTSRPPWIFWGETTVVYEVQITLPK